MSKPLLRDIIEIGARLSNTPLDTMLGPKRSRHLAVVRSAIYVVARKQVGKAPRYSLPQIGEAMGGRDHSSVSNGIGQHLYYRQICANLHKLVRLIEFYAVRLPPFVAESDWYPRKTIDLNLVFIGPSGVHTSRRERERSRKRKPKTAADIERNRIRRRDARRAQRAVIAEAFRNKMTIALVPQKIKPRNDFLTDASSHDRLAGLAMMRGSKRLLDAIIAERKAA